MNASRSEGDCGESANKCHRKTLGRLVSETHFLRHACKERKESLSPSPRLIPGHNQSLVSGVVLDIPSSHSEAGRDVLESMTSLSLTDIFK